MSAKVDTKIYNTAFFARYTKYTNWKGMGAKLASAIYKTLEPKTLIDLGCGAGHTIQALQDAHGVKVHGVEGSIAATPYFPKSVQDRITIANLTNLLTLPICDTVVCLEVAEHIHKKYGGALVENCVSASSKYIVFSAAPPGQGGKGHINCRKWGYWEELFDEKGFQVNLEATSKLQRSFKAARNPRISVWYITNTRVLQKRLS